MHDVFVEICDIELRISPENFFFASSQITCESAPFFIAGFECLRVRAAARRKELKGGVYGHDHSWG